MNIVMFLFFSYKFAYN